MDINFHYYAVKTLAIYAGFTEKESQIIANYSQFVDDFTLYKNIILDDVPLIARHLAIKEKNKWVFCPVTTGFESWFDMARLITLENQKKITIPFHFIPPHCQLNKVKHGDERIEWRVVPAKLATESLIQILMLDARNKYQANPSADENLIRIGLLLHIFADTYAHQMFSGFQGWENYCMLTQCFDQVNNKDVIKDYRPNFYHTLPAIGHTEANHAPDDSNLYFIIKMKRNEKDDYSIIYQRSNSIEFGIAAKEIIDYLRSCRRMTPMSDKDWNILKERFYDGFRTDQKNTIALNMHWKKFFPDINYDYDKNRLMSRLLERLPESDSLTKEACTLIELLSRHGIEVDTALYEVKSMEFFHYNVIAAEIRNFVNGQNVSIEELSSLENALNEE